MATGKLPPLSSCPWALETHQSELARAPSFSNLGSRDRNARFETAKDTIRRTPNKLAAARIVRSNIQIELIYLPKKEFVCYTTRS